MCAGQEEERRGALLKRGTTQQKGQLGQNVGLPMKLGSQLDFPWLAQQRTLIQWLWKGEGVCCCSVRTDRTSSKSIFKLSSYLAIFMLYRVF